LLNALSSSELSAGLNLHAIRDRSWQIFATSAKDGTGLQTALDHMVSELQTVLQRQQKFSSPSRASSEKVQTPKTPNAGEAK
jgi:hypothetical protein